MTILRRPAPDEYHTFYERYVLLVEDGALLGALEEGAGSMTALLRDVPEEDARLVPAPGRWSLKQVVAHVSDTERVFAFRLLWIARGGSSSLPGFDQDAWARARDVERVTLRELLAEFEVVRRATLHLVWSLREEDWERRGVVGGHEATVRALAWIIAGHQRHHEVNLRGTLPAGKVP